MRDQAFRLRELIQTALPEPEAAAAPAVPMVVVSGAKAGVGATTVAVNLAAVLADRGQRVVLIDAAQRQPKVAEMAGISRAVEKTVADVMSGASRLAEALAPGPCGCLVLANRMGGKAHVGFSRHDQQRLLLEFESLSSLANVLVVDAGCGLSAWTRRLWLRAGLVVLVTTTEDLALIDAYALIKGSMAGGINPPVRVLANQCNREARAQDAYQRLSSACQRFLSRAVPSLPALPCWAAADLPHAGSYPRVWESPNSAFGHGMLWLGSAVPNALAETTKNAVCRRAQEQSLDPASSIRHPVRDFGAEIDRCEK